MKLYSESCMQNREPILSVIEPVLRDCSHLLEIGSGTGQHAVYFAEQLPALQWQCSDLEENHESICAWIADAKFDNVHRPIALDVLKDSWPANHYDAVFSANTLHIMSWEAVQALFAGVGRLLSPGGEFLVYGPFNYHGDYTSESNRDFDKWLRHYDPDSGIRDLEAVDTLAQAHHMSLIKYHTMPVNNRLLHWRKT